MGRRLNSIDAAGDRHPDDQVIFSYIDGIVWMSRSGDEAAVMVGTYDAAKGAMRDFLAQSDLAEMLIERSQPLSSTLNK